MNEAKSIAKRILNLLNELGDSISPNDSESRAIVSICRRLCLRILSIDSDL